MSKHRAKTINIDSKSIKDDREEEFQIVYVKKTVLNSALILDFHRASQFLIYD